MGIATGGLPFHPWPIICFYPKLKDGALNWHRKVGWHNPEEPVQHTAYVRPLAPPLQNSIPGHHWYGQHVVVVGDRFVVRKHFGADDMALSLLVTCLSWPGNISGATSGSSWLAAAYQAG